MKKRTKIVLAIALCLCLISGIFASLVQSSFNTVKVEDFKVIVDDGRYVNGQIYIPKDASPENKLPLIVLSHGSYNNLDHQDQNMIELSRRGFVVISTDAYGHGSSTVTGTGLEFTNMQHVIDYAVASYTFIDTEKIGVSGHSMGGQITTVTVEHYFEQAAKELGPNLVSAICTVGWDPQYTSYEFEGVDEPVDVAINWGVIAAKYDEWFFKDENGDPRGYLQNPNAVAFVNQLDGVDITEVENHKVYKGTIDGEEYIRVINQNDEIHPLNHFSRNSCRDLINFFYEAFGVPAGHEKIDANDQIWQWKEFFNLLGLIGIFLFLFPFASLLIHGTKFFGELAQQEPAPAPALSDGKKKARYWIVFALNTILPALLVMPIAFKLIGKEFFVPTTFNRWFGQPNTNELAAWTLAVGVVLLAVFLIAKALSGEKGIPDCWGVKASARVIWKSILLALLVVFTAYVILFFNDLVFNTDYRIWVIDMRVFNVQKLVYFLAYVPAWIVFYLVNSLLVNGGNRIEGRPEWLTLLLSCVSNILGIAVLIFIQYRGIIANGTFAFNSMRIVNLFPLIVLIPLGTIVSRRFFKETGKIYTGSLVIAFLYTMMTVANTMNLGTIL
jgi:dienelactone hydrolase